MNAEIEGYIDKITQPWQAELCRQLDAIVHRAIPDVTEKLQYGKPHYRRNNRYAAVIGTAKGWVTLTIFNATAIDAPEGLFEDGPPERKTVKLREGQAIDEGQLEALFRQAASTL